MNTINFTRVFNIYEAVQIYREFKQLHNEESIVFDFTNSEFIYANFTALFGALIDSCKRYEIIMPKNEKIKTVLSKNNFFPYFDKNIKRLKDKSNSVVEFDKFELLDTEKQNSFFEKLLIENLLKKKGVTNLSEKVLKEVSKSIIELFANARDHSASQQGVYIAGQFFPKKGKFDFTIVDLGIGIKQNVNAFKKENLSGVEAIKWAVQRQNSTKIGDPRGLGLALLKELIIKSNGKIEILSNDGLYRIKNGQEDLENLDFCFDGTIVNIEFNIEKNKKYFLEGEITNEN